MMKLIGSAAATALMVGLAAQAYGQATTQGDSSVTVLTPIGITAGEDLTFGQVAAPASGSGTVVCDTAGSKTVSGLTQVGDCQQATFSVTGESGSTFSITLPETATLTGSVSGSLTVSSFNSDVTSSTTIGASGTTVNVGATLTVPSTTAAGSYTGTYDVTVDYN